MGWLEGEVEAGWVVMGRLERLVVVEGVLQGLMLLEELGVL